MATKCYAMVRGSALRVTDLEACGDLTNPIRYGVSKSVAKVTINEVTESGSNELIRNNEDEARLHFVKPEQTVRYTVDIDFLRVDPGLFHLITGVPVVYKGDFGGFGEMEFGIGPFGEGEGVGEPDVVGFDGNTRLAPASFALEVWSRLAGEDCLPGQRQYGYTLFPFLKGGVLSGFTFSNGAVSFSLKGAQTRRSPKWDIGPYDLEGTNERLLEPVSRNLMWRTFITTAAPPIEQDGVQEFLDFIDNGTASNPHPFAVGTVDGGSASVTSADVVSGGHA